MIQKPERTLMIVGPGTPYLYADHDAWGLIDGDAALERSSRTPRSGWSHFGNQVGKFQLEGAA